MAVPDTHPLVPPLNFTSQLHAFVLGVLYSRSRMLLEVPCHPLPHFAQSSKCDVAANPAWGWQIWMLSQ